MKLKLKGTVNLLSTVSIIYVLCNFFWKKKNLSQIVRSCWRYYRKEDVRNPPFDKSLYEIKKCTPELLKKR